MKLGCRYEDLFPFLNGNVSVPSFPECALQMANSASLGTPVAPLTNVSFICNAGYSLVGPKIATCQERIFTWTQRPTCEFC